MEYVHAKSHPDRQPAESYSSPAEAMNAGLARQLRRGGGRSAEGFIGQRIIDGSWTSDGFRIVLESSCVLTISHRNGGLMWSVNEQLPIAVSELDTMPRTPVTIDFNGKKARKWPRHDFIASRIGKTFNGVHVGDTYISLFIKQAWHLVFTLWLDRDTSQPLLYWQEDVERSRE